MKIQYNRGNNTKSEQTSDQNVSSKQRRQSSSNTRRMVTSLANFTRGNSRRKEQARKSRFNTPVVVPPEGINERLFTPQADSYNFNESFFSDYEHSGTSFEDMDDIDYDMPNINQFPNFEDIKTSVAGVTAGTAIAGLSSRLPSSDVFKNSLPEIDFDNLRFGKDGPPAVLLRMRELIESSADMFKTTNYQRTMCKIFGVETYEEVIPDILNKMENLAFLGIQIKSSSSTLGVITAIMVYVKHNFNGSNSYLSIVYNVLARVLEWQDQAGSDWLEVLKKIGGDWTKIEKSKIFKKVSLLITVCTTLTMMRRTKTEISIKGLVSMINASRGIHMTSRDMFDAVAGTVMHFVERGFMYFKTSDWRVFFADNVQAIDFDKDYVYLSRLHNYAMAGDYEQYPGIDDDKYADLLYAFIDRSQDLISQMPDGFEKRAYQARHQTMLKNEQEFDIRRSRGTLRESPFGISIYGRSSVGKSFVTQILSTALMLNFDIGKRDQIVSINEADKYDSNLRSNTKCIIIDDIANTREEFIQTAPTQRIISLVNNVPVTAVMADVSLKGRVQLRPKLVFATSNLRDLGAHYYSHEPVAVLRRFPMIVTCRVKPEFCAPGSTMLDRSRIPTDPVPDIWDFDVHYVVGVDPPPGSTKKNQTVKFVPYFFENRTMEGVNIHTLLRLCFQEYELHRTNQRNLVANATTLFDTMQICPTCSGVNTGCRCDTHQQALVDYSPIDKAQRFYNNGMRYFHLRRDNARWWWKFFHLFRKRKRLFQTLRFPLATTFIAWLISLYFLNLDNYYFIVIFWVYLFFSLYLRVNDEFSECLRDIIAIPNLSEIFRDRERDRLRLFVFGSGFVTICYFLFKTVRTMRNLSYNSQGNLLPKTQAEVDERDSEPSDWARPTIMPLPTATPQRTTTMDQLLSLISRNMCYVQTSPGNFMNVIFIKPKIAIIPFHIFDSCKDTEEFDCTFVRNHPSSVGGTFKARISRCFTIQIGDADAAVTWIGGAPPMKDLSNYLFDRGIKRNVVCTFVRKMPDGEIDASSTSTTLDNENNYPYMLRFPTYRGLCGGVLLSDSKDKGIMGIHIEGVPEHTRGKACSLLKDAVLFACNELNKLPGYCPAAAENDMPTELYQQAFFIAPTVHEKSPVCYLEPGSTMQLYGSCTGAVHSKSEVVETSISEAVAEVTGVPNLYGPPKFRGPHGRQSWWPYREALVKCGQTSRGVPNHVLQLAVEDYIYPLLKIAKKDSFEWKTTNPLTPLENVSGRDGVKFINAMDPNTSVGYPLGGSKGQYLEELLDGESRMTHACPRALNAIFWDEAERMERLYAQRKRAYPIFKACLKDEAVKKSKDKVRVFQAAPMALQLIVRKYYLPVARLLSVNPLTSECAVGVNAIGPEWHQLTEHMTRFGRDNILAGDYSKYDLTMSPQLMYAAFSIMIRLARHMNYTEEDIVIMESVATDICHPIIAYQGSLVELLGSNPSGHNLTVYINSLVNSLLLRSGYFFYFGPEAVPFRSVAAIMTYGDDVKGSVDDSISDKFNHITYAHFVSTHADMTFTMPNKEDAPKALMSDSEADFLKRKNVFMEELGQYVGALDEDSIFKSLHCSLLSSSLTPNEQAASNIDTAIREWFYHGKEVFQQRLSEMREVATKTGLATAEVNLCSTLDFSFDHWVIVWKNKYYPLDEPRILPPPDTEWRNA